MYMVEDLQQSAKKPYLFFFTREKDGSNEEKNTTCIIKRNFITLSSDQINPLKNLTYLRHAPVFYDLIGILDGDHTAAKLNTETTYSWLAVLMGVKDSRKTGINHQDMIGGGDLLPCKAQRLPTPQKTKNPDLEKAIHVK